VKADNRKRWIISISPRKLGESGDFHIWKLIPALHYIFYGDVAWHATNLRAQLIKIFAYFSISGLPLS